MHQMQKKKGRAQKVSSHKMPMRFLSKKNQERFSNSKRWWPIFLTFLFWARGRKTVTLSLVFKDPLSAPLNALRLFFHIWSLRCTLYITKYISTFHNGSQLQSSAIHSVSYSVNRCLFNLHNELEVHILHLSIKILQCTVQCIVHLLFESTLGI